MTAKFGPNENIDLMFDRLEKFLRTKTVVGEPVEVGDATLIPFITTSFRVDSNAKAGMENKEIDKTGDGAGLGAEITPTAVLVIKKDDVQMIPIKENSNMEKLMQIVPDILVKLNLEGKEKKIKEE